MPSLNKEGAYFIMKKTFAMLLALLCLFSAMCLGSVAMAELSRGARGDEVARVQQSLIKLGYLNDVADGIFGEKTAAAVSAFQRAKGLPATGVVDDATAQALEVAVQVLESASRVPAAATQAPEADTQTPEAGTQAPEAGTQTPEAETQAPEEDAQAQEAAQTGVAGMPIVEDEPIEQEESATVEVPIETQAPSGDLRLSGIKIGIDPGHQRKANLDKETISPTSSKTKYKVSGGTAGRATRIPEYQTVLEIAFKLRDNLTALDAEVYMTRESHDVNISNQERAKMMNNLGVDLVLRIHCDGSDNTSKQGIGVYATKTGSIAASSYAAAQAIMPRMLQATGAKEYGIFRRDSYTGQNWSTVPCIMVECGFMSNKEEDVKLNTPAYQQKLADGMTQGICDYFGR